MREFDYTVVVFTGADGERNEPQFAWSDGVLTVRDVVGVTAVSPCRQVSPMEAECDGWHTRVLLGDGDDSAHLPEISARVDGGPGSDVIFGGPTVVLSGGEGDDFLTGTHLQGGAGDDQLTGTEGNDDLRGGAGSDRIAAGAGTDWLFGDDQEFDEDHEDIVSPDSLDGGEGQDTVSYAWRFGPVTVDLEAGRGGAAGEGDELGGIENIEGGFGPDRLIGTDAENLIRGNDGDDVVEGLGGDDVLDEQPFEGTDRDDRNNLYGGDGNDVLTPGGRDNFLFGGGGDDVLQRGRSGDAHRYSGGTGDDLLRADAYATLVFCGDGNDLVSGGGALVGPSCEQVANIYFSAVPYPTTGRSGRLVLRFACLRREPCAGVARISAPGSRGPAVERRYSSATRTARIRFSVPRHMRRSGEDRTPIRVELIDARRLRPNRANDFEWQFDLERLET